MRTRTRVVAWLIAAGVCAAGLWRWVPDLERDRLEELLKRRGATFEVSEEGHILWLKMAAETTDDDLSILRNCSYLKHLYLAGSLVTDEGLRELGDLPQLQLVDVSNMPRVTNGLEFTSRWKNLREIRAAENVWVNDEQVAHLGALPRLTTLNVRNTNVSDAAVGALSRLPALQSLDLKDCEHVTDKGLAGAMQLPHLKSLGVTRTAVTWQAWQEACLRRPELRVPENPLLFAEFRLLREAGAAFEGTPRGGAAPRNGGVDADQPLMGTLTLDGEAPAAAFDSLKLLSCARLAIHSSSLTDELLIPCLRNSPRLVELDVAGTQITARSLAIAAEECPELHWLNVSSTPIRAESVAALSRLARLHTLRMQNVDLEGVDFSPLSSLRDLMFFHLSGSRLDDAALASLPPLPKLEYLSLARTRTGNEGVESLARQPALTYLDLSETGLQLHAWRSIAAIPGLEGLTVGPDFTREAAAAIQASGIRHLTIREPSLGAEGIIALEPLSELTWLALEGTVPEETLLAAANLSRLQSLSVDRNRIDAAVIAELRSKRPDLEVSYSYREPRSD